MDVVENRPGRLAMLMAVLALAACEASGSSEPAPSPAPAAAPAPAAPAGQWYRASLDFGEELPPLNFFLFLPDGAKGQAVVVNGDERIELAYDGSGDRVHLAADWNYESEIEATRAGGRLHGQWRRYTPFWGEVILQLEARPIDRPDPDQRYEGPASGASIDGNWELTFQTHGPGRAQLSQKGNVVTGFVRPGNLSDMRFLAGNLRGSKLLLSTFNGNAANLFSAEISADGKTLRGVMSLQNVWNEEFTGKKVAELPRVDQPHLRQGATSLTIPALKKRLKGRPALVVFFATWCPSCNDAFPFLVDLAGRFRPKGVEVIGLNYELSEDVSATERQLRHFREKYRVDFDLVQVPTTPDKWAGAMPPELEGWDGLPVFAFIGADGIVRHLRSGWWTPAAPEQNKELRQQFEEWMLELVPR